MAHAPFQTGVRVPVVLALPMLPSRGEDEVAVHHVCLHRLLRARERTTSLRAPVRPGLVPARLRWASWPGVGTALLPLPGILCARTVLGARDVRRRDGVAFCSHRRGARAVVVVLGVRLRIVGRLVSLLCLGVLVRGVRIRQRGGYGLGRCSSGVEGRALERRRTVGLHAARQRRWLDRRP